MEGLLVRFNVSEFGDANNIHFEDRQWDPVIVKMARLYLQSCRFTPSKIAGKKTRGSASGRLTFKPQPAAQ